ncbi:MAG: DUF485 domain-containing protein [Sedimentisphaerales bacterium]|nr:DUF485 domain-containing protein [Sedimentisphaerales bacterium]MBN2842190.1 DUF485 domain-containing protein [Sedimentisphaerales bacterium]
MLHEPAQQQHHDPSSGYKTVIGAWMFLIYAIVYVGFVTINLVNASLMAKEIVFGLNLACVYGFGLILLAMIMALIYNFLCTKKENQLKGQK